MILQIQPAGTSSSLLHQLTGAHGILVLVQLLAAAYLSITFIQSSLDKIFNYKSNLDWLKGQFSKTFLAGTVSLLLPLLTLTELAAGLLTALGGIFVLCGWKSELLAGGFVVAGIAMLMLLFGQRVSKEYAGAASLTGYFLIMLVGLLAVFAASLATV